MSRCLVNCLITRYFGIFSGTMRSKKEILSFLTGLDRNDGSEKKSCGSCKDRLISIAAILLPLTYVRVTRGSVQPAVEQANWSLEQIEIDFSVSRFRVDWSHISFLPVRLLTKTFA